MRLKNPLVVVLTLLFCMDALILLGSTLKEVLSLLTSLDAANFVVYLSQTLTLAFLMFFIGLLTLFCLQLSLQPLEVVIYSVGLSISFLMAVGLLINEVGPLFGLSAPLSMSSILPIINGVAVLLIWRTHSSTEAKGVLRSFFNNLCSSVSKKDIFLLFYVIFLLFITFEGAIQMKVVGNNVLLMLLFFLFSLHIPILMIFHRKFSERVYILVLAATSLSLIYAASLRSNYILGYDVHGEYYAFELTSKNLRWNPSSWSHAYNSVLSVTILPTVLASVGGLDGDIIFKVIFPFVYSLIPLAGYTIFRRYFPPNTSFGASFIIMSMVEFLYGLTTYAKVGIALFFFTLCLVVVFDERTSKRKERILLLVFLFSLIVSHYATAYLFLALIVLFLVATKALQLIEPSKKNTRITPLTVLLSIVAIFLWYGQLAEVSFQNVVLVIAEVIGKLQYLFSWELKSPSTLGLLGLGRTSQVADMINLLTSATIKLFLSLGLIYMLWKRRKTGFPLEYSVLATLSLFLYLALSFLPLASLLYGVDRLTLQTMILVAPAYFLGGKVVANTLKKGRNKGIILLSIILSSYFLSQTGFFQGIFGQPNTITLSTDIEKHGIFVHEQEVSSIKWLTISSTGSYWRYGDFFSTLKLWSYGSSIKQIVMRLYTKPNDGYVYFGYSNVVERTFWQLDQENKMRSFAITPLYNSMLVANKIFDNGESQIFKV